MEEEIDAPKAAEEDIQGTNKTPPKTVKTPQTKEKDKRGNSELCIVNKWGRLLSLHPALPHVDLVSGITFIVLSL